MPLPAASGMRNTARMHSWSDLTGAAPDVAELARARIEAHGLALIATLRRDGSPRISGIEPLIAAGELWLAMMPRSRKAADLDRAPRFALHNATVDKQVTEGDVKIDGRAIDASDDSVAIDHFVAAFTAATGNPPPPGPFRLFRADIRAVATIRPAGDHLAIDWWSEHDGLHHVDRY
jgi:hypothetical protein